jgi:putative ABC transport system permease protein
MIEDNLLLALKNIRERKTRVFLTLLGIAIGIMAIVSLMSIGEGMQLAVKSELSSLSDTIFATIGIDISASPFGGGFNLKKQDYFTDRDIADISRVKGIKDINPLLAGSGTAMYNGLNKSVTLLGIESSSMQSLFGIDLLGLEWGNFLRPGDQNKCLIGHKIAYDYFDTTIQLGNKISINGKSFFVAGIYKEEGIGFSTQTDDSIHLTPRDFKKLTGQKNFSVLIIKVLNVDQVKTIASEIEETINENHGSDDFASVVTMVSILESIQSVLGIIQAVLIGIAAIALIVASIGIMNTMLTSVMERTHEIGVMKAIGADSKDIMSIFLLEGTIISLLGGIAGIIIGIIGANGLVFLSSNMMGGGVLIKPVITILSISLGVIVALIVGVTSSFYPAYKAARMSPIEAVRYE